eukprot:762849-Hanusia_phi.AAC.3
MEFEGVVQRELYQESVMGAQGGGCYSSKLGGVVCTWVTGSHRTQITSYYPFHLAEICCLKGWVLEIMAGIEGEGGFVGSWG